MTAVNIKCNNPIAEFHADLKLKPSFSEVPEGAVDLYEKFVLRPHWVVLL